MKTGPIATISRAVSVLHGAADVGVCQRRYAEQLHEAKSALVELIEAATDARDTLHSCIDALSSGEQDDHDALARLNAALARVGGAP